MSVRKFLDKAKESGDLVTIDKPVDVQFEVADVANALSGKVVLFTNLKGYEGWRIVSGMCADRKYFSMDLNVPITLFQLFSLRKIMLFF